MKFEGIEPGAYFLVFEGEGKATYRVSGDSFVARGEVNVRGRLVVPLYLFPTDNHAVSVEVWADGVKAYFARYDGVFIQEVA